MRPDPKKVSDLNGMRAVVQVEDAHLWRVFNDNTIHAALHGAYQMIIYLATIDRQMKNQDINLASSGVVICDGTQYDGEFNQPEGD